MTMSSRTDNGSKKDLWLRLRRYHFDHLVPPHLLDSLRAAFGGSDTFTQAFADKLARKLRWSVPFAMAAIDEYKKFVYLGMVAEFQVTPPRVIDRVWHEHLLFSKGYREFCAQILGRDFDHFPELVAVDEQTAAFQAQYVATLELYQAEFGRKAPSAFWGAPKFAVSSGVTKQKPTAKRRDRGSSVATFDDTPLYMCFEGAGGGSGGGSGASMPEFGGGTSGGAGGGADWSDHGSGADSTGGHTSDGGSASDGGSSGGGSSDGGSGCSSGCSSCGGS